MRHPSPLCLPSQVERAANKLTLRMPHQLFIGGEFVDAEGSKTYDTINPTDGSVSAGGSRVLPTLLQPGFRGHGPGPVPGWMCLFYGCEGFQPSHRNRGERGNEGRVREAGKH